MLTETDQLFLDTLSDIEQRARSEEPYQILGISALARKLLLDSIPLVDQVNRSRRLKIRFNIGLPIEFPLGFPQPSFYSIQDAFDPDTALPGMKPKNVKKDGLLAATVLIVNGKLFSVRDLVSFEAHVKGGVHAGNPGDEADRILQALGTLFQIGGYRASLRQLQAVGRVVLKGSGRAQDRG